MLHVSTAGWAATIGAIAGLLALDLLISARRPHAIGFREAEPGPRSTLPSR